MKRRIAVALIVSGSFFGSNVAFGSTIQQGEELLSSGGTVYGGVSQSNDPTRFDYVPRDGGTVDSGLRSAKGYEFVPAFEYSFRGLTIPVPGGQIYHRIDGNGLRIDYETMTYTAPANICNYRVDYQNRDMNGNIVFTHSNGDHLGCQFGMVGDNGISNVDVQPGMMCARLFVSGAFRGGQCHHVYP